MVASQLPRSSFPLAIKKRMVFLPQRLETSAICKKNFEWGLRLPLVILEKDSVLKLQLQTYRKKWIERSERWRIRKEWNISIRCPPLLLTSTLIMMVGLMMLPKLSGMASTSSASSPVEPWSWLWPTEGAHSRWFPPVLESNFRPWVDCYCHESLLLFIVSSSFLYANTTIVHFPFKQGI